MNNKDRRGRQTVLTKPEEDRIEAWVLYMARAGFPVSMTDLTNTVSGIAEKLRKYREIPESFPSKNWSARFLQRHPKIKKKVTTYLPKSGAKVTEQNLRIWFKEIADTLAELRIGLETLLALPPECFLNFDESGWQTVAPNYTALCSEGADNAYCASNNSYKESFTVMFGGNAKGDLAPPLILYAGQRCSAAIAGSVPAGWSLGFSEEGWQTAKTFYEYVVNVLFPWLQQKQTPFPVLLFFDGHTSHVSVELIEFCISKEIILISLFPNATRILQPLDRAFFGPFKKIWTKMLHQFHVENRNAKVEKINFGGLIKKAFDNFRSASECLKRGLYPWNPDAIDYSQLVTNVAKPETTTTIPEQLVPESSEESESLYLAQLGFIEAGLEASQVTRFNNNRFEEYWLGPIEELALFNFWKKFKDLSEGLLPTEPLQQYQILQIENYVINDNGECVSSDTVAKDTATSTNNHNDARSNDDLQETSTGLPEEERSSSPLRDILNVKEESDAFENSLIWPRIDEKLTGSSRKKKEHVPSVATSERWRKWHTDREEIKSKKQEAVRMRQEERKQAKLKKEEEKTLKKQEKLAKAKAKVKVLRS